jgi:hypothetical protein
MWTRKSVKQKGKGSFFKNFWKCVLVALILSTIVGAMSNSFSGSFPAFSSGMNHSDVATTDQDDGDNDLGIDVDFDTDNDDYSIAFTDDNGTTYGIPENVGIAVITIIIISFFVSLIITAIALAVKYFLLVPFEYGCRKFFRKNLDEPAKLSNIVYVFDSHYKNVVKTAFMTELFIWLWSLLFVIPGIIKSYEYRLVPYIVSENPNINYKDALAESKKLMQGNKWKSFVLDLSFIGWDILSLMTWGFLDIFFVGPYKASTDAALYETLKYGIDAK